MTADEARRGREGAALLLASTIHSWAIFMMLAAGTLVLDELLGRAYPVWIFLLETLLVLVAVPWMVVFVAKLAAWRSTPYRLLQRVERAVAVLNPVQPRVRVAHGWHWDEWYSMSRMRARRRRRLVTLAWQLSGDLAVLSGRPRRRRDRVKGLGTWLLWAAEDIDDIGRREIVTRRCVVVVAHVVRPDPWLELAMKPVAREAVLVRPRFGDHVVSIVSMFVPTVIGPIATVAAALVAALVR
ncbi:hypothetical protein [Amycolatopsis samaneae]|uniref:Uncharacterized protein n=1 Tax=Amycolatopsis samaneae TaxID=664691 RepID=A0ABW5GDY9_9PSEU